MKQVALKLVVTTVFLAGCSSSGSTKLVGGYKIEPGADLTNANLLNAAYFSRTTMPDGSISHPDGNGLV